MSIRTSVASPAKEYLTFGRRSASKYVLAGVASALWSANPPPPAVAVAASPVSASAATAAGISALRVRRGGGGVLTGPFCRGPTGRLRELGAAGRRASGGSIARGRDRLAIANRPRRNARTPLVYHAQAAPRRLAGRGFHAVARTAWSFHEDLRSHTREPPA